MPEDVIMMRAFSEEEKKPCNKRSVDKTCIGETCGTVGEKKKSAELQQGDAFNMECAGNFR